MKKIANKITLLFMGLVLMVAAGSAQPNPTERTDKVTFLNGTVKEGKVIAFAEQTIRFVYRGETLNYEFNKREIEKIEYASGRTEVITGKKEEEGLPVRFISKNKVAVIPIHCMGNANNGNKEDMGFYLQEIIISYLSKSAAELKFMDATEVNALLIKNGISDSSIRRYTPGELAALLHAEYIIMGSVLQDNGSVVTNASGNGNITVKEKIQNNESRRKNNFHESISVITNQHVETQVSLSIYNETGEKIYSRSRHSLLSERDAYKNTIHYLLKRTALYKR